jgi:hypothetical protein
VGETNILLGRREYFLGVWEYLARREDNFLFGRKGNLSMCEGNIHLGRREVSYEPEEFICISQLGNRVTLLDGRELPH